jgi:hypothetical protein
MEVLMTQVPQTSLRTLTHDHVDLVATGTALSVTLVGLFVLCALAVAVWPTGTLAHGYLRLFSDQTDLTGTMLLAGILGSLVAAWATAVLFVPVYNWIAPRR